MFISISISIFLNTLYDRKSFFVNMSALQRMCMCNLKKYGIGIAVCD